MSRISNYINCYEFFTLSSVMNLGGVTGGSSTSKRAGRP